MLFLIPISPSSSLVLPDLSDKKMKTHIPQVSRAYLLSCQRTGITVLPLAAE